MPRAWARASRRREVSKRRGFVPARMMRVRQNFPAPGSFEASRESLVQGRAFGPSLRRCRCAPVQKLPELAQHKFVQVFFSPHREGSQSRRAKLGVKLIDEKGAGLGQSVEHLRYLPARSVRFSLAVE